MSCLGCYQASPPKHGQLWDVVPLSPSCVRACRVGRRAPWGSWLRPGFTTWLFVVVVRYCSEIYKQTGSQSTSFSQGLVPGPYQPLSLEGKEQPRIQKATSWWRWGEFWFHCQDASLLWGPASTAYWPSNLGSNLLIWEAFADNAHPVLVAFGHLVLRWSSFEIEISRALQAMVLGYESVFSLEAALTFPLPFPVSTTYSSHTEDAQ
jgi:hypothetical protein